MSLEGEIGVKIKKVVGPICEACKTAGPLTNKYKRSLCEYCVQVIEEKYPTVPTWCGWCEEKVISVGEGHHCDEGEGRRLAGPPS